jgi:hypothetical protein
MEQEVFRVCHFEKNVNYAFALKTRTQGSYPSQRYYTTHPLQYLGKHVNSARWGYGDNGGGSETFDNHGLKTEIIYDYEGNSCFKVINEVTEEIVDPEIKLQLSSDITTNMSKS